MARAGRGVPPCSQAAPGPREQDGAARWGELGVRLLPQREAAARHLRPLPPPPIMHLTVSWPAGDSLSAVTADSHGHSQAL